MQRVVLFTVLILNSYSMSAQNQDPWSEYITPSEVHALLTKYTGSFKMEITMSMGVGKEPSITIVNSEHHMLLDGRFLEMKQHGVIMGMNYQSIMTLGYNNTDKQMNLTSITNMGTGTLSLCGSWDPQSKSANLMGLLTNPVSKGTINVRQTISFVDEDTILIESYDTEGDKPEKKTVTYKLTRIQ